MYAVCSGCLCKMRGSSPSEEYLICFEKKRAVQGQVCVCNAVWILEHGWYIFCVACMLCAQDVCVTFAVALLLRCAWFVSKRTRAIQGQHCVVNAMWMFEHSWYIFCVASMLCAHDGVVQFAIVLLHKSKTRKLKDETRVPVLELWRSLICRVWFVCDVYSMYHMCQGCCWNKGDSSPLHCQEQQKIQRNVSSMVCMWFV